MLSRRAIIVGALVIFLVGLFAGKAWASIDTVETGTIRFSGPAAPAPRPNGAVPPTPLDFGVLGPGDLAPAPEPAPDPEAALRARIAPSIEHWDAIHDCEQRDSWTIAGVFGNGLTGGGGLGISDGAWHEWGGDEFASRPGLASPLEQMVIASVGWNRYGPGPWGCKAA